MVVRDSGQLVGDVGLHLTAPEHAGGELGYAFHPDHRGRGYATEATRAIVTYGFTALGLHRINARLEPRNAASAAVAERLGMRREADLIENEWVKGEWQSERAYAILVREWAG